MATDPFGRMNPGPVGPYTRGLAVTPSDSAAFDFPMRGLWVGGTGAVAVELRDQPGVAVTLAAVPAGTLLPVWVTKVFATGTTATQIVALA